MEKKNKKRAWLWILLCLPTVFIVYFFLTLSDTDINPDKVSVVTVAAPDGEVYTFTEKDDISFYVELYLNAAPLSAPIREVEAEDGFAVTIKRDEGDVTFNVFPEINTNGCFLQKADGSYGTILAKHSKSLLQRSECAVVYDTAGYALPSLSFVSGNNKEVIVPKEYTWQYQNIAGTVVNHTTTKTADQKQSFNYDFKLIDNPIDFSVEPTEMLLSFTDSNGNVLQETAFGKLYQTNDTVLTARLEARWDLGGKIVGGSAVYEFEVFYDVHPELMNTPAQATAGSVIYLTFRHLSANETVVLDTMLDTAPLNIVYDDGGDYAYIAMPVSVKNSEGEYSVSFTIGDVKESFSINIIPASTELNRARMDTELYIKSTSPDGIEAYAALMREWHENKGEPMIEAGNKFGKPTENKVLYNYGTYMSVNDVVPYFHLESIDYQMTAGDSVKSAARGVIIYMGEDEIHGKMMVIDHGYGVLSHYYNLGEFIEGKAVGDTVQEGVLIGTAGVSGMTYKEGEEALSMLRFGVSVNGVFVNPNRFFTEGFDLPIK